MKGSQRSVDHLSVDNAHEHATPFRMHADLDEIEIEVRRRHWCEFLDLIIQDSCNRSARLCRKHERSSENQRLCYTKLDVAGRQPAGVAKCQSLRANLQTRSADRRLDEPFELSSPAAKDRSQCVARALEL